MLQLSQPQKLALAGVCVAILLAASAAWASDQPSLPEWQFMPRVPDYEGKVIVLLYHHISPHPSGGSTITPEQFRSHLAYLKEAGFNVVSLEKVGRFMDGQEDLPPRAVAITFDDGYESFYNYAFPALREFGYPATMFVIVSSTGITPNGGSIQHLSWDEMRAMLPSGLITFGSHSYDQHRYVRVDQVGASRPALVARQYDADFAVQETEEWYEARIRLDLALSKALMEQHLGVTVDTIAVPYGASNEAVDRISNELGFRYLYLVTSGVIERGVDHYQLRRVNAGSPTTTISALVESMQIALDPGYRAPGFTIDLPGVRTGIVTY